MKFVFRLAAIVLGLAAAGAALSQSDALQEINRLMKQGQHAQALDRVNAMLATKPRDAQGRFLKGLILTEQNKIPEAIEVFTRLSQDYPELPEPYNNLAVLYAAQGQYEKARASLETSIRTHPSYATAYENLGDVYTKLASQAYDKALQFDTSNTAAQSKLSLIRDLITATGRAPRPGTRAEPPKVALAAADASKVAPAAPKPPAAETKPAGVKSQTPPAAETKPAALEPKAAPKAPEKQAEQPAKPGADEIVGAVRAWAAAWAKKDADAYLSHYAKDFKTPKGEPRGEWEKMRRQRIAAPKKIEVSVDLPKVTVTDENNASVTFRQSYHSDSLKAVSTKTLVMVRSGGKWRIRQERVGN